MDVGAIPSDRGYFFIELIEDPTLTHLEAFRRWFRLKAEAEDIKSFNDFDGLRQLAGHLE